METDSIKIFPANEIANQESLVNKLIEIDRVCYGEIDEKDEGSGEYWNEIAPALLGFVAVKDGEPVGYIDFVILNDFGVEKVKTGLLRDGELKNFVELKHNDNEINLNFVSAAILSEYRKNGLGQKLLNFAFNYFKEKNLKIKNIYATIWTPAGHAFMSKFNYKVIAKDPQGREVVVMEIGDF
jgi:GNAT superfamily N-acetyltransferase